MLLENEVCGTTTSKLCTTDATICRLAVACLLGFCRIKPIVIGCHGSDSNIRLTLMAPITFGSELKLDWPFLEHINSWAHKSCICKYNAGNEINYNTNLFCKLWFCARPSVFQTWFHEDVHTLEQEGRTAPGNVRADAVCDPVNPIKIKTDPKGSTTFVDTLAQITFSSLRTSELSWICNTWK